jgi:hypothetical protein
MKNNDTDETIRQVLEIAAEVIAVVLMIIPFFQSQDSKKK